MRNQVILTGRPIRYEEKQIGGLAVGKVTLYLPGRKSDTKKSGQFFKVDVWGITDLLRTKISGIVDNKYKTEMVISGQLEYREWEGKDGKKQNQVGIKCNARDVAFRTPVYLDPNPIGEDKVVSTEKITTGNYNVKYPTPPYVPHTVVAQKKNFNPKPSPPSTEVIGEDEIPF